MLLPWEGGGRWRKPRQAARLSRGRRQQVHGRGEPGTQRSRGPEERLVSWATLGEPGWRLKQEEGPGEAVAREGRGGAGRGVKTLLGSPTPTSPLVENSPLHCPGCSEHTGSPSAPPSSSAPSLDPGASPASQQLQGGSLTLSRGPVSTEYAPPFWVRRPVHFCPTLSPLVPRAPATTCLQIRLPSWWARPAFGLNPRGSNLCCLLTSSER